MTDEQYCKNVRWLAGLAGASKIITECVLHIDYLDDERTKIKDILLNPHSDIYTHGEETNKLINELVAKDNKLEEEKNACLAFRDLYYIFADKVKEHANEYNVNLQQ